MKRSEFVKTGCVLCTGALAGIAISSLLGGCATAKVLKKPSTDNKISVNVDEFTPEQAYLVIRTPELNYDICLYRKSETEYSSVLMQCTHYDNPVFANKKELFCPSHGSTFNFDGKVSKEPATQNLKQFKTELNNKTITIFLS